MRDISALGACISTPYYIFASEFALSFDEHSETFTCRLMWRRRHFAGCASSCAAARRSWRMTWCGLTTNDVLPTLSILKLMCRHNSSRALRGDRAAVLGDKVEPLHKVR